jgi:lipoprotein signal peptidase
MPASLESVEKTSIGRQFEILSQGSTTNNSQAITEDTVLPWLADIFYIPSWMPFSNVFSIGDVLIAIGVCIYIIRCMKPVDKDMEAVDAK